MLFKRIWKICNRLSLVEMAKMWFCSQSSSFHFLYRSSLMWKQLVSQTLPCCRAMFLPIFYNMHKNPYVIMLYIINREGHDKYMCGRLHENIKAPTTVWNTIRADGKWSLWTTVCEICYSNLLNPQSYLCYHKIAWCAIYKNIHHIYI